MLAKALTGAVIGSMGAAVEVEVDSAQGLPYFFIVGLPDAAVQEARKRVKAAVKNTCGYFPMKRVTVNLAPADLQKEGMAYDLPIAVGMLIATGQIPALDSQQLFLGELSLGGTVRHTNGILPMVSVARDKCIREVFVSLADAPDAVPVEGMHVFPAGTLAQLVNHLRGDVLIREYVPDGRLWTI